MLASYEIEINVALDYSYMLRQSQCRIGDSIWLDISFDCANMLRRHIIPILSDISLQICLQTAYYLQLRGVSHHSFSNR